MYIVEIDNTFVRQRSEIRWVRSENKTQQINEDRNDEDIANRREFKDRRFETIYPIVARASPEMMSDHKKTYNFM